MSTEARITVVAQGITAKVAAMLPLATVDRAYGPRYDRKTMSGAYVWVYAMTEAEAEKASRGLDFFDGTFEVHFVEKCEDRQTSGEPEPVPTAWIDERVRTVEGLYDVLRNERIDVVTPIVDGAWPERVGERPVVDPGMLTEDRVFWSWFEVTFRYQA